MDQPGKVANPARGQLNRENDFFPVPVRAWEFQTSAALAGHHGPINMRPSFPHPLLIWSGQACWKYPLDFHA